MAVSLTKTETITNSLKEALVYENKSHALNELLRKRADGKVDKAKAKIADEYQAMVEVASNKKGNLKAEEKAL